MSKYPGVITPEILAQHAHTSASQIKVNIEDTLAEISQREQRLRILNMEEEALEKGIKTRQEFIEFLERLIEA